MGFVSVNKQVAWCHSGNSVRAKRSERDTAKMDKALCVTMATGRETMGHARRLAGPRLQSGLESSPRFQYPLSEQLVWRRTAQQLMGRARGKKKKRNWKRSGKKQCGNLSWRMMDSLLTLTDDHLRERKHLTLSASSSLNVSLEELPFHSQAAGLFFDFYDTRPTDDSPFPHATCKCAGVGRLTSVLMAKNKQIGNCSAAKVDSSWQKFLRSPPRRRGHFLHWCTVEPTAGNMTGQPDSIPFREEISMNKKKH